MLCLLTETCDSGSYQLGGDVLTGGNVYLGLSEHPGHLVSWNPVKGQSQRDRDTVSLSQPTNTQRQLQRHTLTAVHNSDPVKRTVIITLTLPHRLYTSGGRGGVNSETDSYEK